MKVIVTGANGFVGSAICDLLENESFEVIKFVRPDSKLTNASLPENTYAIDITKKIALKEKLKDVDAVIHAAGLAHQFGVTKSEEFHNINVIGTENVSLFTVDIGAKHLILMSSVSVYGDVSDKSKNFAHKEQDACNPTEPYEVSKLEAESVCKKLLENHSVNLSILRLATVIGEEDKGNVFRLIKLIDSGKFIWIGDGSNYKSLICKDDVARAVLKVLLNKRKGTETFNVSAEAKRMSEIVSAISESLSSRILPVSIPSSLIVKGVSIGERITNLESFAKLKKTIKKWITDDVFSSDKFREEYGFIPETSIEEALKREVLWYLEQK